MENKNNKTKKSNNTKKTNKVNKTEEGEIKPKKVKTKKKHKILKRIILFIILLIIIACLVLGGIVAGIFFSDKYKVSKEDLTIERFNTVVKDADGNIIATLTGEENRKWVNLEDMPSYLPKAFLAIEDKRFYEHNGIDIVRTAYATVNFILEGGESSFGGSTVTQQLIKNLFEDNERSGFGGVERKIREMARAYNVEKVLSKDDILELYLNLILMGGTYYGVGTGSEYYFSKTVDQITIDRKSTRLNSSHL